MWSTTCLCWCWALYPRVHWVVWKHQLFSYVCIVLSCQKWTGKKVDPPVHFWQKKWTGGSTFFCQKWTCLAKSGPGPFCQEKSGPGPVLAGEKSGPGPVSPSKSKQVCFWQGKKVDPVQFRRQNLNRSVFGRGKKWTRSSFAVKF